MEMAALPGRRALLFIDLFLHFSRLKSVGMAENGYMSIRRRERDNAEIRWSLAGRMAYSSLPRSVLHIDHCAPCGVGTLEDIPGLRGDARGGCDL